MYTVDKDNDLYCVVDSSGNKKFFKFKDKTFAEFWAKFLNNDTEYKGEDTDGY